MHRSVALLAGLALAILVGPAPPANAFGAGACTIGGTITFTLYSPSNVALYTDVVTVNGAGNYSTAAGTNPGGYLPTGTGTYLWSATYSGDSNNTGDLARAPTSAPMIEGLEKLGADVSVWQ